MCIREGSSAILRAWVDLVRAHDEVLQAAGDGAVPSPADLVRAFSGALVAERSGGTVDPFSDGMDVALPDGGHAVVGVVAEEAEGGVSALRDVAIGRADWLVVVVFSGVRPVTLWAVETMRIPRLLDALGLDARGQDEVVPGRDAGCARLHAVACRHPELALAHGIRAHRLSADGSCRQDGALGRSADGRSPLTK